MTSFTRRLFLGSGLASAAASGLLIPSTSGQIASGRPAYTRYDVNSPEGQVNLEKYARAVRIMKGTPPDFTDPQYPDYDPRSYTFQWYTHWTDKYQAFQYQDATEYKEDLINAFPSGAPTAPAKAMWNTCQAHGVDPENPEQFQEWFFLPWHRLYLYYFEQIIRNVLRDNSFSLPYWDAVSEPTIPVLFRDSSNPLYDSTRFLNTGKRIDQVVLGLNWLSYNALSEPFYIDSPTGSFGFCTQVDINPHFLVHQGVGGDMRNGFNTAALDPPSSFPITPILTVFGKAGTASAAATREIPNGATVRFHSRTHVVVL
jgi:hypothetical protein